MVDLIERGALLKSMGLTDAVKYGNKDSEQQTRSYSTWMSYEIADAILDAPSVNRWIPCIEKLPDNGIAVLVYTGENNFKVWLAEYSKYMEVWTLAGNYVPIKKNMVSHWMPLPEPPEKE